MVTTCRKPGCTTLVMGGFCIEHEEPVTRAFVRGRPLAQAHPTWTLVSTAGRLELDGHVQGRIVRPPVAAGTSFEGVSSTA